MHDERIVIGHGGIGGTLTKLGVAIALRAIAKRVDGRETPDEALEWALHVGYLALTPGAKRGSPNELALTPEGEKAVWAYWKMWGERRAAEGSSWRGI